MLRTSAIFLLVALPACEPGSQASVVAVHDSLGVTIVQLPSDGSAIPELELAREPFGEQVPEFGSIVDVAIAPGGGVVVLDGLGSSVVVLSASGAVTARFGREGAGPGELRGPGLTEIVMLGDTIAVPDVLSQRVTLFGPLGEVLEVISLDFGDGLTLDWQAHDGGGLAFRRAASPPRLEVLSPPESTTRVLHTFAGPSAPPGAGPLTPLPVWCQLASGSLATGRTDRYELAVVTDPNVTTHLLRGGPSPRALQDADLEHISSLARASISRRAGADVDPELIRRMLEQMVLPDEAPLVAKVLCSGSEVWVQHSRLVQEMSEDILRVGTTNGWGSGTWDVIDVVSGSVHRVRFSEPTQITRVSGALVVGVIVDEFGRAIPARWLR
jgi:hypothetical protein